MIVITSAHGSVAANSISWGNHVMNREGVREIVIFSAGLISPAADGSQGHVSSHAERLRDLPPSRECNVTRYSVGGVAVQVRAHSPCSGGLVCGISASRLSPRPPGRFLIGVRTELLNNPAWGGGGKS